MNNRRFFHIISYLQYPLMLLGLFFAVKPYFQGIDFMAENMDLVLKDLNTVLVLMGLGISFSTLQDTTKTQNELSRKIWEDPRKGQRMITFICCLIALILAFGIFGYFLSENEVIQEFSFGAIVLGIGLIGLLKSAIEMFENHRKDKKDTARV